MIVFIQFKDQLPITCHSQPTRQPTNEIHMEYLSLGINSTCIVRSWH